MIFPCPGFAPAFLPLVGTGAVLLEAGVLGLGGAEGAGSSSEKDSQAASSLVTAADMDQWTLRVDDAGLSTERKRFTIRIKAEAWASQSG